MFELFDLCTIWDTSWLFIWQILNFKSEWFALKSMKGKGVKNPQNSVYVVYGCPLMICFITISILEKSNLWIVFQYVETFVLSTKVDLIVAPTVYFVHLVEISLRFSHESCEYSNGLFSYCWKNVFVKSARTGEKTFASFFHITHITKIACHTGCVMSIEPPTSKKFTHQKWLKMTWNAILSHF